MVDELTITEKDDGFVAIRLCSEKGIYQFWILPTKKGYKLSFEIKAEAKGKGEVDLA